MLGYPSRDSDLFDLGWGPGTGFSQDSLGDDGIENHQATPYCPLLISVKLLCSALSPTVFGFSERPTSSWSTEAQLMKETSETLRTVPFITNMCRA